ncbi:MAG: hypothetical protein EP329_20790 [Deltaproteobacteria bacterium]|nr:MAG: hypothetical protein EP329_20790 [Deltaproteobacteria bacterium]
MATELDATRVTDAVRPRPLWRRILKWTLVTIGVLLALVLLTVLFFHTGPGKEIARGAVEDVLAKKYDGTVTLGGLDYALFGDLSVDDLKIVDRQGRTALHLKHLGVSPDWGELLGGAVVLDKVEVDGVEADPVALKAAQKEETKLPGQIVVRELDVKNVAATIVRPDGAVTKVTGLTVHGLVGMGQATESANASLDRLAVHVDMTMPNGVHLTLPLETRLEVRRQGPEITLQTPGVETTAHVELPGQPARDVPVRLGALDVKTEADKAHLDFAGLVAGPLSGERLTVDAQLGPDLMPAGTQRVALTGVIVDAAKLAELLGRPVLKSDVRADIGAEGPLDALVVKGDVKTDGGTLALRGTVDASRPPDVAYDLKLTGDDIDTAKLLAEAAAPVKTSLELTVKGKGIVPGAMDANVRFTLGPTDLNGRPLDSLELEASAHGATFAVDKLTLSAFGQTLEVVGSLDRDTRRFSGRIKTVAGLADAIAKARDAGVLLVPLPPVAGSLDVDITAAGTLLPEGVPMVEAATQEGAIVQLAQLPIERMTLKGHLDGSEIAVTDPVRGAITLGRLNVGADVVVADQKPTGTISLGLGALDAGKTRLDDAKVEIVLDGLRHHITVTAKDEAQKLDLKAVLDSVLDLDTRSADVTLAELTVARGSFDTALLAPVTLHIAPPDASGDQAYTLPRTQLSLAGGSVSLGGTARFRRDPEHPEATVVSAVSGDLDFEGLSLGRLAALARKSTRGASGTLSGHLSLDGTPTDPAASFAMTLRARAKDAAPVLLKVSGAVQDARLRGELRVTDVRSHDLLAEMTVKAPLSLGPGAPPGLAPGGKLAFALTVPERRLGALAAYAPGGKLPKGLDPDATLGAHAGFSGTPAQPTGDFGLTVSGGLVAEGALKDAPERQRLTVDGKLGRQGGKSVLEGRLAAWLDAAGAPLLDVRASGDFARSPLLRGALAKPWRLDLVLQPIGLAGLPLPQPVGGAVSGNLGLSGEGGDLFGHGGFALTQLTVGTAPAADVKASFALERDATSLEIAAAAGGLDIMSLKGSLGLAGGGLRTALKRRLASLADAPVDFRLSVPKRALEQWGGLAPKPVTLPGDFGGDVTVSGTVGAPVAKGELSWDGFTALSGIPGRVALLLDADGKQAGGALEVGPRDNPLVRLAASTEPMKVLKREPFDVTLKGTASGVDLLSLLPAAVAQGGKLDLSGLLDCDLEAIVHLVPEGGDLRLDPAASRFSGGLTARDLRAPLPGSERVVHDGLARLTLAADGVALALAAHESDEDKADRSLAIDVKLALEEMAPKQVTLGIKTQDWLVLGLGLDNPEGELDLDTTITVTQLTEPIKDVDILVSHVDLNAPYRFVRGHYQQFASWGDVLYLDETGMPSGKLKPPKAPEPEPEPAEAPATAEPAEPGPPSGIDVHLRIPEPIHVAKDPLAIDLKGGMEVALREDGLAVNGRIDVVGGVINVMGWPWELVRGAVTVDGGLETFLASMTFERAVDQVGLREIAVGDDERLKSTTITITIDMVNGQQLHFAGAAGPYLLDVATLLNTGRVTYWSQADLPASVNVQFGQPEQGLVNTFVQDNLRQLVFMDRANGWSDPIDDPRQYGRIWHFVSERYLPGGGQRVRFVTRPPGIASNHVELQYDLLFDNSPRSVVGAGARLGDELRLGLGFFWEFWSRE